MKTSFSLRALALVLSFLLAAQMVSAAEYHVVIGAFAHESNARRFTGTVRNFMPNVSYSFDESKNLYYVTALKTQRKDDARNWCAFLRTEKGFLDAWVLARTDAETGVISVLNSSSAKKDAEAAERDSGGSASSYAFESEFDNVLTAEATVKWSEANEVAFIRDIQDPDKFHREVSASSARLLKFIVEDEKGNAVPSEVMLVNFEKAKMIASFTTGEHVAIKGTKAGQMITFVCDKLGYKQETRVLNIDHLDRRRDVWKNDKGVWEVRIRLKRWDENEIAFLNKTLFYKDAAVLNHSSEAELDELVSLMKQNLNYQIILHSHCNPGTKREIRIPAADGNYFDMDATVEKSGADKLLTKKRAEVVKDYLVRHGIDKKRIDIVAWGSMEPVVKTTGADAQINERIEIELARK